VSQTEGVEPEKRGSGWASSLRVGLGAAIALALGIDVLLYTSIELQDALFARDRDKRLAAVSEAFAASLDQGGRFALATAEAVSSSPTVVRALATQDRKLLTDLTAPAFKKLQTHGVKSFGFQTPDLKYFLRLQTPENFGDDLSKSRPILLAANKSRRPQMGLERSASGILLRGVTPVGDGDAFAGTVEVGVELAPLLEELKSVANADVAILARAAANDSAKPAGELTLVEATDSSLFARLLWEGALANGRDRALFERRFDGVDGAMLVEPITDFSGESIGVFVAVKRFPDHDTERRQTRTDLIATGAIAGIVAFAAFSLLARLALARRGTA